VNEDQSLIDSIVDKKDESAQAYLKELRDHVFKSLMSMELILTIR
jgi:hypothetical protein